MKRKIPIVIHPLFYLILLTLTSLLYSFMNQTFSNAVDITIPLDNYIPFIKEFSIPYLLWHPFIYGALIYYFFKERKKYHLGLASMVVGKLLCFIVYFFWQTTVPRREVVGEDVFSQLVRFIYSMDNPVNCLPSIHVLTTAIIMLLTISRKDNKWEYYSFNFIGISIILSTMFIEQHGILDVIAGILLAVVVYMSTSFVLAKVRVTKNQLVYENLLNQKEAR